MNINVTKPTGVICKTQGKYCAEDITVVPVLEEKSATPTESAQEIVPSAGNCGISKLNLGAVQTETKTVAPSASAQTYSPSSGKYFANFTVSAVPSQSKTVTPTKNVQTVNADSGKWLSSVTVNPIPDAFIQPSGSQDITANGTYDVTEKASVNVNVPSGVEEVATAAAMDALLVEANVGKYYKFTGTTDSNYTNGDLYLVEGEQGAYKFKHYAQEIIPQGYTDCLTFTGEASEFTLKATHKSWVGTLEWSTDHTNWTTLTGTEAMQSVDKKLYLRGKCVKINTKFVLSEKAGCNGNIQTLLDYENPPTSVSEDCYRMLFNGCTNLTTAPELPATTLAKGCYRNMFNGCTNLTIAPELPATTLAEGCYGNMFQKCTNLTTAPELPATTLAGDCYVNMFTDCTNLTTAPELPATTLAANCYAYMFIRCTNLTKVPELPATTLARECYRYMFNGCTNLKVNISSGNKIFTCPSTIPEYSVEYMFNETGGSFTGTPTAGTTYYYTE